MLRVICTDDVKHVVVVRGDLVTAIVRPLVIDLTSVVEQTHALLTAEESAIIRCAFGARADTYLADYRATMPSPTCPCYIPAAFRSGAIDWPTCPLHGDARPAPVRAWGRLRLLAARIEHLDAMSPIGTHGGLKVAVLGLVVAYLAQRNYLTPPRLDMTP